MKRARGLALALVFVCLLPLISSMAAPGQTEKSAKLKASAIQILKIESDEVKLPPEFQMALYENMIREVGKAGKLQHVYRDGERGAADATDLVILRSTVRGFKEGSARARQVTTVAGATSIKVHLQFAARDGHVLLERDVAGNVHFFGENLRATYNLAKNVAKLVNENF